MLGFQGVSFCFIFFFANYAFAEKFHFSTWIKTGNSGAIYFFETVSIKGIKDCFKLCKAKKQCKYINIDIRSDTCYFVGVEVGNEFYMEVESRKGYIFGNKSEWEMDKYEACNECEKHGVCGQDEQSTHIYTDCQNSGCGPPIQKPFTVVYGNMYSIGDKVKYECSEGYKMLINIDTSSSSIQQQFPQTPYVSAVCQEDGSWTFPEFQCFPKCSTIDNAGLINRARGKLVTLSSGYDGDSTGELMVDGNLGNVWPCACTTNQNHPWAIIDLQWSYTIKSIYVINRMDCCPERLPSLTIQIGDELTNLTNAIHRNQAVGAEITFMVEEGIKGRYVKLQIQAFEFLTICELEVCTTD